LKRDNDRIDTRTPSILQRRGWVGNTAARRASQRLLSDLLVGWRPMNVEQLRRALADLPGETPIAVEDSSMGWMENAALYLAPAHVDRRVSGNFLYACHLDGADNCHALLISSLYQSDEALVDISPQPAEPLVIDAEADPPQ
jgi:hypothetical protein